MSSKLGLRNMVRWTTRRNGPSPFSSQIFRRINRANAARTIQRAARSRLFTMRRRKNVKGGMGITTQHDARRIYTKRNMPSGKKKRWKGFINKVHAVSEKELGARQVVFNVGVQSTNTTSTDHITQAFYLYGQKSSTSFANDLQKIGTIENEADPTAAAGTTVADSTKYMFQSAILDLTVVNHSTYQASDVASRQLNSTAKMEVDVYECIMRIPAEETGATKDTFQSVLDDNSGKTGLIGGTGTKIDYRKRGVTPWELSYSLSRWGVKILKKTKYMVPNGESFTYQVRDPRRRTATNRDLDYKDGFNRPGWTRIVYFVGKLTAGLTVGTTTGTYQEVLDFGVTRKYLYKVEGINDDRTQYFNL